MANEFSRLQKKNRAQIYPIKVSKEIHKDYPMDAEFAILRKAIKTIAEALDITLPEEFCEYHDKAEQIKAEIKAKLDG